MDADFGEQHNPRFLNLDTLNNAATETSQPPLETPIGNDLYPAVPAELKQLRQWVVWLYHPKDGEENPSKVLYQTNGWAASTTSQKTWTTYRVALACYQKHRGKLFDYRYRPNEKAPYEDHKAEIAGIGFVFTRGDPYCGIDLDHCLNADGKVKAWAAPIIEQLKAVAYGEVSPSREGIKFWTKARLPKLTKHKIYINEANGEAIEAYDSGRYFTVTGRGKGKIGDGQAVIDWLVKEYLTPDINTQQKHKRTWKQKTDRHTLSNDSRTADEVIALIRNSRQCQKFDGLMRGNMTGHGSPSEADSSLCSVIAFWTQDPILIDAIFRRSQLHREKWDQVHRSDGATYGEMTIEYALSQDRETHKPPPKRKTRRRNYRRKRFQWL